MKLQRDKHNGDGGGADKRSRIVQMILQKSGKGELRNDQQRHYLKYEKQGGHGE